MRAHGRLESILACAGLAVLLSPAVAQADGKKPSPEQAQFMRALKNASPKAAAAPVTDGDAGGKLGTRRMRQANKVASEILERRMRRKRAGDLKLLRAAGAADVVVVRGSYDRVQDVLRALKVKHVLIPPRLLARVPLMSTQTLMINCPGRLNHKSLLKVRRFVKTGGFLVTTDWALTLVTRAFPGYVKRGKRNTKNDVVRVQVRDSSQSLLANIKAIKRNPRWWLESSSYPIRVLNKQKVKVLISSREMRRKYGHAPIAITFRHDDGRVLHMTSHFYLQQAKLRGRKERASGASFAKAAGLKPAEVKALRRKGLGKVRSGELNSAYSMQQVTANVVVSKQKQNRKLLKKYRWRAKKDAKLRGKGGRRGRSSRKVGKGYRLREIKRKGKKVKVRDLFGNEGWMDQDELE